MRIRSLNLQNFKRFHKLHIDLGETRAKIVALVGPNGCGKSSVFDAFEEHSRAWKPAQRNTAPEFLSRTHFIDGGAPNYERSRDIQVETHDDTPFERRSIYIRTSYRFSAQLRLDRLGQQPDVLVDQDRPHNSAELDSRLSGNFARLHGKLYYEYQHGSKVGRDVRAELVDKVNAVLAKILSIEISDLGDIVGGKGQLFFGKGVARNFPYENLSAGEKEVVDLVLDVVTKSDDFNDTVYCIDEPELHLNTSVQRALLVELEKLLPDTCQLWVATHSVGFLRALQEELVDKTAVLDFSGHDFDGAVTIRPMEKSRKNYQRLFQTALDDLTGLIAPRVIVYCEGRHGPGRDGEEVGFDALVYNAIFEAVRPDTLFVSSGGQTEPDRYAVIALTVLGKAFSNVDLLVLKDRDIRSDGNPTTEAERVAWIAEDPDRRRMLMRREVENYLMDFEVVDAVFARGLTRERYAELVTDVINGDLKPIVHVLVQELGLGNVANRKFLLQLAGGIRPGMEIFRELESAVFPR